MIATPPCLILAAGFGTRMGALTQDRPKPLIEVAGKPLLAHALDAAAPAPRVFVNAHYRADQIAAYLAETRAEILIETPDILDSGGAVKNALAQGVSGPIATLNADAVWAGVNPLTLLTECFEPARMDALLLLVPRARAIARQGGGDFHQRPDGTLAFDRSEDALVYTGAQIIAADPILAEPRRIFSLRDIWARSAEARRLYGLVYAGEWADVGHPDGIAAAEAMGARHV